MRFVRKALQAWLSGQLGSGWRVVDRLRLTRIPRSRAERELIMGSRYAEMAYVPSLGPYKLHQTDAGGVLVAEYDFDVYLYLLYKDADLYEHSSWAEWDEVLERLLSELRKQVYFDYSGQTYLIEGVSVKEDLVALDVDLAHWAQVRVRLSLV